MKTIQEQISIFLRLSEGCTLYRLAKEADVNRVYVYRLMNGVTRDISTRFADRLRSGMRKINKEAAEQALEQV